MKNKKRLWLLAVLSILLIIISFFNSNMSFVDLPTQNEMVSRQIDFITISTVFAGFSFTTLGLLLGLSSEKLIERVKNTTIIQDKVDRIITSIIFFILSVVISLFFVLGLNNSLFGFFSFYTYVNNAFYILGVGYLVAGIGYFVKSVYELYDLIQHVYRYNKNDSDKRAEKVREELEEKRRNLRKAESEEE